jgi:hypothetical protein
MPGIAIGPGKFRHHHAPNVNDLLVFYSEKVTALENAGQYFMAAVALGFAPETAILTYLLVEFGARKRRRIGNP